MFASTKFMVIFMKTHLLNITIFFLLCCLMAGQAHADSKMAMLPAQRLSNVEARLLQCINDVRQNLDVELAKLGFDAEKRQALSLDVHTATALVLDEKLVNASVSHTKDMIERFYISTITPDAISPRERLIRNDYLPLVNVEFVDAVAVQNVLPDSVLSDLFFNRIIAELSNKNKVVAAVFNPNFNEVSISVMGFAILFEGVWHNVYLLAIDVATEASIDGNLGAVVLGHVYVDRNANNRYDYGEGVDGAIISVVEKNAVFGPIFQAQFVTGYDGFYVYSCPIDTIYSVDIFYRIKYQADIFVKQQKIIDFDIAVNDDLFFFHP